MSQLNMLQGFKIPNGDLKVLPSWIINPDSPEAVSQCESDLVQWFIHERTQELEISHEEAMDLPEPERMRLVAEGAIRAIKVLGSGEEVQGRALHSLAFKMMKASAQVYDGNEPETFEDFLLERLGHVKSAGAISETKFMLELLEMFEKRGNKNFVEGLFKDRKGFAKFSKAIPMIRARQNQLVAGERHFEQVAEIMDKQIRSAKTEADRKELIDQAQENKQKEVTIMDALVGNLEDTLVQAVELTRDPSVDADKIPFFLSQIGRLDESTNKSKLPVEKLLFAESVVYLVAIRNGYEKIVEQALQDFCEIFVEDPQIALEKFRAFLA